MNKRHNKGTEDLKVQLRHDDGPSAAQKSAAQKSAGRKSAKGAVAGPSPAAVVPLENPGLLQLPLPGKVAERRKQTGKELRGRVDRILFPKPRGSQAGIGEPVKVAAVGSTFAPGAIQSAAKAVSELIAPKTDDYLFDEVHHLIEGAPDPGKNRSSTSLYQPLTAADGVTQRRVPSGNRGRSRHIAARKPDSTRAEEGLPGAKSQSTAPVATTVEELEVSNRELKKANETLEQTNATLAAARDFAISIVATVRQPLVVLDGDLRIRMANRAFYQTFQSSPDEVEGQGLDSLWDGIWNVPGLRSALVGVLRNGGSFADFEIDRTFPRVGVRNLIAGGCGVDHLKMILLAVQDVTQGKVDRHALLTSEGRLRQAEKMEAIGRLAGGIAHDFNNLLTAVIGYSDLLREKLLGNDPALDYLLEIKTAGQRAASLTHQLLSFSRRQVLQPRILQLNTVIAEFEKMLRSLVGEPIRVTVSCSSDLWPVRADPGEIGRAIMNLWLNARDAMPNGGVIGIETANMTVTKSDVTEPPLQPGQYVTMSISDTGVGMSAEVQARIFEPFFTTKGIGKGTGLGLATVMGIVEQSGGVIQCKSVPGQGTAFTIYLPAVMSDPDPSIGQIPHFGGGPRGSEVILVVEDEDAIRKLARVILEASGYKVLDARDGREGLAICESHSGPIDLLVTDVMMPELNGRELARGAFALRPDMKVLFTSGHTEDVILKAGIEKGMRFLQKPFTAEELATTVRETIDLST